MSSAISGPIYDGVAIGDEVVIDNRDWLAFLPLPPPPGARRQPCDPPVRHRREAGVPAETAVPDVGAAIDDPRRRPLRSVRREDDRGAEHERRLRVAPRRTHVRAPRPRRARCHLRRPIPPLVQRPRRAPSRAADVDAPGELPRERRAGRARPRRVGRARDRAPVDHGLRVGRPSGARSRSRRPRRSVAGSSPSSRSPRTVRARAEVRVGDTVTLEATAEVPPGAGTLVRAEWDFDGSGAWPVVDDDVDGSDSSVSPLPIACLRRTGYVLSRRPRDRAARRRSRTRRSSGSLTSRGYASSSPERAHHATAKARREDRDDERRARRVPAQRTHLHGRDDRTAGTARERAVVRVGRHVDVALLDHRGANDGRTSNATRA